MRAQSALMAMLLVAVAAVPAPHRDRRDAERLDADAAVDPLDAEVFGADPGQRTDREKRLLLEQKVQIGNSVKHAVLNLIFGKINSVIDAKSSLVGVFERANAAKNLALLGPGTKRPPAASGFKSLLTGVLTSSLGSSSGGGSNSGGFGASLGASLGGSAPAGGTSSSSSFSTAAAANGVGLGAGGYDFNSATF